MGDVAVSFAPLTLGDLSGQVTFDSNGGSVTISLAGTGANTRPDTGPGAEPLEPDR